MKHQRNARGAGGREAREAAWRAACLDRGAPGGWSFHRAGDLAIALQQAGGGARARSLFDLKLGRELLAADGAPLFTLVLRHSGDLRPEGEATLTADSGWRQVAVQADRGGFSVEWSGPLDERLGEITVRARARADARRHAWRWTLSVDNARSAWSVWRAAFPQLSFARFDEQAVALVPSGPGELKRGAWDGGLDYKEAYGQAWCTMQFMAVYAEAGQPAGLYLALHDPLGSTKDLLARSDPASRSLRMAFDQPAPDMGRPGNGFSLSGEAVWQLLRGDWFDAAAIYRDWARQHARWWPALGSEGRADTPAWMREVSAWLQGGFEPGTIQGLEPSASLAPVKRFRQWVDVPVALHWYAWHQIPFDNDYPHYFPAKEGFAEAVRELQQAGIRIMPYINGRLWDTRDRGSEDFEFSAVARPAATKDEAGQPYVEHYGSQEADGSPVQLAVMCPAAPLWQERVRGIVSRLVREVGVDGVYIDQVAAAKPTLCMDAAHGHPLGGGHWWNEGYWRMIQAIQDDLPDGRMITTECNAEAFIPWFDGYLTWHWQHDGMVPAFPAVYGGTVQAFGRAYGGDGPARRMKLGQQFVFGEQIGWFGPDILDDPATADFVRQAVRLRWRLRRYFHAGEMARPPRLAGDMPAVKADWQWYGACWVATDAVLTGAWRLPGENRLALLFANVSEAPVTLDLPFNARAYGVPAGRLSRAVLEDADAPAEYRPVPARFRRTVTFQPRRAVAWEFAW